MNRQIHDNAKKKKKSMRKTHTTMKTKMPKKRSTSAPKAAAMKQRIDSGRRALRKERQIGVLEEKLALEGAEILDEERRIEHLEEEVEHKEKKILANERRLADSEAALIHKEEDIRKGAERIFEQVHAKPLRRITRLDINKGIIGAFFGLVSHFAFLTSGRVIGDVDAFRAILILVLTYIIAYLMIERTGYRVVEEQRYLGFIPARVTVIYITTLIVSLFVLVLFDQIQEYSVLYLLKTLAVTSLLAVPGAAGAHMLGHQH